MLDTIWFNYLYFPIDLCNTGLLQRSMIFPNQIQDVCTPLCRLCGRLDDLISEPNRAVGATVTAGNVILIGLPRMAR